MGKYCNECFEDFVFVRIYIFKIDWISNIDINLSENQFVGNCEIWELRLWRFGVLYGFFLSFLYIVQ